MRTQDTVLKKRRGRGKRIIGWLLMALLAVGMLIPVGLHFFSSPVEAQAENTQTPTNERANYWREVRQGTAGYTAVTGQEANVLIQNGGENWRSFRQGPIPFYSAWLMAFVVFAAGIFHIINGPQKLDHGRSGLTIERWTLFERVLHWYVGILFIILAFTGLSLLYGRHVLIPVLGKDAFAAYAMFAKMTHNYLGPFFSVGMLLMIIIWIKDNLPIKADLEWAKSAGGMWGEGHPPADKANAGEKLMFWQFAVTGTALIITGFILNFPNFEQTREVMQWSLGIHVIAAVIAMVTTLGHMYMALFGVEGALEGMIDGRVDTAWAKQHHDIWYEKQLEKGVKPEPTLQPQQQVSENSQAEPRSI
jgi:formate dehydrogenase subunit gamma